MTRAVDTLVLDLGNVLLGWDPLGAFPELSRTDFDELAERIGFYALNLRADAGESWADLDAELARQHPEHAGLLLRYVRAFPATLTGPVPGMAGLVAAVQRAGVATYGLTNWSAETYPHGVGVAPVIGTLEGVVVSGDEGAVKPDPEIYRILLDRYDLDPTRALFVDDSARNVEAARALGLHGHLFTDAVPLFDELVRLGVLEPGADDGVDPVTPARSRP